MHHGMDDQAVFGICFPYVLSLDSPDTERGGSQIGKAGDQGSDCINLKTGTRRHPS